MTDAEKAEVEAFVESTRLLTAMVGPQRPRHLYEFAGYVHNHDRDLDIDCPDDCRQSGGLMVWLLAVMDGLLIGDGVEHGETAWRPYEDGEPFVMVGQTRHTPRSAIWAQARADQEQAELSEMTDEDWAEAERNVAEIQKEIDS